MTEQKRSGLPLLLFFLVLSSVAKAQQSSEKFIQETTYLLSLPHGYIADTTTRWPLMIFLHGSGEAGSDIEKVKAHGPPKLIGNGKQFPMIVVSPQSDVSWGWNVEMLYKMLQDIKKRYRVNADKVYLTGLSMGGFGTFSLAIKYPDEFAAIAPVCGGGDSSQAWKLRHLPAWVFHGAKDDVVPPRGSENMVLAEKRYNSDVHYTLYPDANHNSWDVTYNNDSLYSWFLSKSRHSFTEQPITAAELQKFEGSYLGENKDTVKVVVEEGNLIAKPPGERVPLKYAGSNVFFIEPSKAIELWFIANKKEVTGFLFMGNDKMLFTKLK